MPTEMPSGNMTSAEMDSLVAKLKAHKLQKAVNQSITDMDQSIAGVPPATPGQQVKQAYWAGVKYATDTISENSSEDNPAIEKNKNPEEEIIDIIRRGWPDPQAISKEDNPDASDKFESADEDSVEDSGRVKDRAQLTKFSPKVTV